MYRKCFYLYTVSRDAGDDSGLYIVRQDEMQALFPGCSKEIPKKIPNVRQVIPTQRSPKMPEWQ